MPILRHLGSTERLVVLFRMFLSIALATGGLMPDLYIVLDLPVDIGRERQVAQGKTFIEPGIAQQLAMQQLTGDKNPVDLLSAREFEVFILLAQGKTVADIAAMLHLSPRTVGTHLYNIKQKLNASNSAEIVLIAMRAGLIENS